jgi:hypothetical protein
MQCPKCGVEQPDGGILCHRCGIVFEKYYKYHPRPANTPLPAATDPVRVTHAWNEGPARTTGGPWDLILPVVLTGGWPTLVARTLLWVLLGWWGLALMLSPVEGNAAGRSVLHLVNLPFHEFGHLLFRPFGDLMASLGGTLGQLLMPAICLGVLLIQTRDPFGASVALWWLGENFLDIAPYINDARAGELPLLGGNTGQSSPYGFHDWELILGETGLLHLDHGLASLSHLTGSLVMLAALSWGGALLWRHRRQLGARDDGA